MSTLSILQMNRKKVIPSGLSFFLYELMIIFLPDALRNNITYRWLTSNIQHQTLWMTLAASSWAVNVLMGALRAMRGMRSVTECDFRGTYMVDASWLKLSFFRHAVLEMGWSLGRGMVMWYFPKWTVQRIILKAGDGFEAAMESWRLQVQATTLEIAEWVVDMVGWLWLFLDRSSVVGTIQRLEVGA